ncbi:MAG TPA: hypothetical protein VKB47_08675 [Terracidiphilus sp.]|nr:hypothetical protein [Terracidiphilus sp.]
MTYEVRISIAQLAQMLTVGYEVRQFMRVTHGLPEGAQFTGAAFDLQASELCLLFHAHEGQGHEVLPITIEATPHPAAEAIAILEIAELDCRGFEALHDWVEPACELLSRLGRLRTGPHVFWADRDRGVRS